MSWTNAAVTEAGLALQAKLVDGQTLGFLRVAAGTGTVDPSVLANQTALANEKQTLTFQPPNVLDGAKIKVPVMLNNIGLETGYTMQQLGFFADDPDDGEILYAIVQDEVGDTVPSQTESPGFIIEWAFVFQYGNAADVTVTIDPSGLISWGQVGQPNGVAGLDENGVVPIAQGGTGKATAQAALAALGTGVRPSRIINGGFKINQRGQESYTGTWDYCFDGWVLGGNTTVTQNSNGDIIISNISDSSRGYIVQRIEHPILDTISTFSLLTTNGLFCATGTMSSISHNAFSKETTFGNITVEYDRNNLQYVAIALNELQSITLPASKGDIAKFEDGDISTLAYQDADGAWRQLTKTDSDYATQLLKCQRYFQLYSSVETRPDKAVDCRPVMRIDPTPGTIQIGEQTYYYNSAEL